jgi:ribosomal protein S13
MKRNDILPYVVPGLVFFLLTLHAFAAFGQIRDRVVAFIDTTAITLSDLEAKYAETARITPNITREEVLDTMINRELLLREARKIRLEAPSEEDLLKEYVDLKIKAFIRIKEDEIKAFYDGHVGNFEGREFDEVRDDIENYLIEKELNQRLKSHINELRDNACIKVQMQQENQK